MRVAWPATLLSSAGSCCSGVVVGTKKATTTLKEGMEITVDGGKGTVYEGRVALASPAKPAAASAGPEGMVVSKPITATEIKVNVSEPDRAEAAAATMADGVGLYA